MFSKIFEKGERPEASEWVSILDDLKKPSALSKCNKVGHRGFKKGCPTCAFENKLASSNIKIKKPMPKRHITTLPTFLPIASKSSNDFENIKRSVSRFLFGTH